jgi:hypothetical protein
MTLHFNKALSIPSMQRAKTLHKTGIPTTDLAYISQLKIAQSPLIKLVLPSHVTDHQAPLMMMKQPLLMFYITD